jgi:glyoxylase-like metal-dependent hydrolase (beta-lactamase superfamily II)
MTNPQPLSRRRFLANASLAAGATASSLWLNPRGLFAQDASQNAIITGGRAAGAAAKITTQKLRGNVSALLGSGGNIAVLTGPDGKLLVDSGYATSQPQLTAALTTLSPDPISRLIDTHWHFDHTDGNLWMHSAGATIHAHEMTRTRLSTPQTITAFNATFPALPAAALPTETFADAMILHHNGATLRLSHYDPAHTDTDISIYFTEADTLHTGDTWFNGAFPFIDYSTGGSINGMIAATARNLAMSVDGTIIIPGHGPVGDKKGLFAFYDMLNNSRDAVSTLKRQGRTLPEIIAAKPTALYDDTWGKGFVNPPTFVTLVYQGV